MPLTSVKATRKSLLSQLDNRWLAAGLAATGAGGAMVAAPQNADAAIVYSGVVNINVPTTTAGVYVNVVTGVNNINPASVPGWDLNPWGSSRFEGFTPTPNPGGGGELAGTGTTFFNVAPNTICGAASTYASAGVTTVAGATPLNFNSSNNLWCFRFVNEANGNALHYGWARFALTGTEISQPRTLVEYAYDNVAGTSIPAGATVPEPGSIALLALGAAGMLIRRRR